jgi:hypothetical protein
MERDGLAVAELGEALLTPLAENDTFRDTLMHCSRQCTSEKPRWTRVAGTERLSQAPMALWLRR